MANLSRFVQPVELDLCRISRLDTGGDYRPDRISRCIGDLPYFLTLGPHSFYWFRLEPQAEPIKVPGGAGGADAAAAAFLAGGWDDFLRQEYRYQLEQDVLLAYISQATLVQGQGQ